jgi:oxygen-independent coproporphyrinogen-3 oxidase
MMNFEFELFEKYNKPVPRYTSYPPANYFRTLENSDDIRQVIRNSNLSEPENISLYIHIPFCHQLCLYCGCNTHITNDRKTMAEYVETLLREIEILSQYLDKNRKVSQIHWGGGTPNYLPVTDIDKIMQKIKSTFDFIDVPEIAMECHPAHLTQEYVDELVKMGFNRLSFGVQDFSEKVLDTVRREKPLIPIEKMVTYIKSYSQMSLNLDFIYGLPYQTLDDYEKTIRKAVALNPDRLAVFSYAHVPWIKRQQKSLEKYGLPTAKEKIALFQTAYKILYDNGYEVIGLDHFAKPQDELSIALRQKKLHRNFQGYCTLETTGQVYALGVSGISQMADAYLQNTKDLQKYMSAVNNGILPVEKIYIVNEKEKTIRDIIENIMCNMEVDFNKVAENHHITIDELYQIAQPDLQELSDFEKEGFLSFKNDKLILTHKGQFFMRNIAAAFDPNMKNSSKTYSKAL